MGIKTSFCFKFNSFQQAVEIIDACKGEKIFPILYVKYYLISGLGIDWLNELRNMLLFKYGSKKFQILVDVKKNYGLFISLVEKKINYINVKADNNTLKRLEEISKLNKVLINPNFSVLDLSNLKNISLKIKKL